MHLWTTYIAKAESHFNTKLVHLYCVPNGYKIWNFNLKKFVVSESGRFEESNIRDFRAAAFDDTDDEMLEKRIKMNMENNIQKSSII